VGKLFDLQFWMIKPIIWILILSLTITTILGLLERIFGGKRHQERMNHMNELFADYMKRGLSWMVFAYIIIISQIFLEEIVFRLPIWWIASGQFSFTAWTAIIISSIVYGLAHSGKHKETLPQISWKLIWIIFAALSGVVAGWLTVTTNSILPSFIIHIFTDIIVGELIWGKIIFKS